MLSDLQRNRQRVSARLLRYWFDSAEQVSRHFHLTAGRVVLFFPTLQRLSAGESIVLEVAFKQNDRHFVLRGTALEKDAATQQGSWLQFSAYSLVTGLRPPSAEARRRPRRFPATALVNVERAAGFSVVGRLADISGTGARLVGARLDSAKGDRLRVALYGGKVPPTPVTADVAWVRGAEMGIRFLPSIPRERRAIDALAEDARKNLLAAIEFTHPSICHCMTGRAPIEPPLPPRP